MGDSGSQADTSSNLAFADNWSTHTTQSFIEVTTILLVLATIAVAIRFWTRLTTRGNALGIDDWVCLAALIVNIAYCVLMMVLTDYGLRLSLLDMAALDPQALAKSTKIWASVDMTFLISNALIKFSALFFYQRVFTMRNAWLKTALWTGHILVLFWYIGSVVALVEDCGPERYGCLAHTTPEEVDRTLNILLWTGFVDVLLDFYILVLPMPVIYQLKMKPRKLFLVAGVFVLGYCSLVVSLGRFIAMALSKNPDSDAGKASENSSPFWWSTEASVAIISICVPSWWHLISRTRRQGIPGLYKSQDVSEPPTWTAARGQTYNRPPGTDTTSDSGESRNPVMVPV